MLCLEIPASEYWDPIKEEFVYSKATTLRLEYSLMSVAKWESKYHKSFFTDKEKTMEEFIDLLKCMTIDNNVDDVVYRNLSNEDKKKIVDYMADPMTAATFKDPRGGRGRGNEMVTAETIYWQMGECNIPDSCEKWHLNRLIARIRFCQAKGAPQKKMSPTEALKYQAGINAARRAKSKHRK